MWKLLLLSTFFSQEIPPILLTMYCSNLSPLYFYYYPGSDTHQLMCVLFQRPTSSFTLSNQSSRLLPVIQNVTKQYLQQKMGFSMICILLHHILQHYLVSLKVPCLQNSKSVQMSYPTCKANSQSSKASLKNKLSSKVISLLKPSQTSPHHIQYASVPPLHFLYQPNSPKACQLIDSKNFVSLGEASQCFAHLGTRDLFND